jgi:hypothetical protein
LMGPEHSIGQHLVKERDDHNAVCDA